jgi:hypothetical protein
VDNHPIVANGNGETLKITLANLGVAFACDDVESRRMQRAFDVPIFNKSLRQQGIGVGTHIFERIDRVVQQIKAYFFVGHINTQWEVWVQLRSVCNVMPVGIWVWVRVHEVSKSV